MRTILDEITANRRTEVRIQKQMTPLKVLESKIDSGHRINSLSDKLLTADSNGIIAEFKRRSPSKGAINENVRPEIVTKGYADACVSGISVLTEGRYFGGSNSDFIAVREANPLIPLLRKDFIVDPYQIYESRLLGADVILLICTVLKKAEISLFTAIAHEIGLEVLLELHDENEIQKIDRKIDMIGINNRNLRDFKVDMGHSLKMIKQLPSDSLKIAESGIDKVETVDILRNNGFRGFLMGENFMKSENPGIACLHFIACLKLNGVKPPEPV